MRQVLLTGAARGIGYAIKAFLERKETYKVYAPTRAEMDLQNSEEIEAYLHENHTFDIVINNAGINLLRDAEHLDDSAIMQMLQVNLKACLEIIRGTVGHMKEQRFGRIVNISSIWGIRSQQFRTLYSMTKFALNGMTRALARELGEYNVLVNAVCPGYVDTELTSHNVSPAELEAVCNAIPLGRLAQPEEIADLVEFLISDRNTYITGQEIIIDGGFLA